mmetsp:Transcript_25560/g.33272  ORF Transcript_25560/g.33272 Transcript_25560/m.33272 type:complete len:345 (+) Transcript_25560:93-1127(+)
MPSMCKLEQHFEFHSGNSSLTLSFITKDITTPNSLDGVIDKKYVSMFNNNGTGWIATKMNDTTFLQCISSIRENNWSLLCNDVVTAQSGWAIRTFFFERKDTETNNKCAESASPTSPPNALENTRVSSSSWATVAAAPAPPNQRRVSTLQNPTPSNTPGAPPPPPTPAATQASPPPKALPPPPPAPATTVVSETKLPPPPAPATTALPTRTPPPAPTPQPAAPPPPAPIPVAVRTAPPPVAARPPPPPAPVLTAEEIEKKERQAEFFRLQVQEKEEKDAQKKKALSKLTPEEREALEAEEKATQAHEDNKTRHFARLGRLAGGGAKQQMGGRGGAGRGGRGRGR